jgi:hypothetical protein
VIRLASGVQGETAEQPHDPIEHPQLRITVQCVQPHDTNLHDTIEHPQLITTVQYVHTLRFVHAPQTETCVQRICTQTTVP